MTREEVERVIKNVEPYYPWKHEINYLRDHDQAQREEISRLLQAVGLASTLKPDMEINFNNPVGMMQQVEKHVLKQREEIAQLTKQVDFLQRGLSAVGCANDELRIAHNKQREEIARLRNIERLYCELLFQVCTKFPAESRHDTALRYIQQAEQPNCFQAQAAKEEP